MVYVTTLYFTLYFIIICLCDHGAGLISLQYTKLGVNIDLFMILVS